MRLSRHARRRMRLYDVTAEAVRNIVRCGADDGEDQRGNPRKIGFVDGRCIRVVLARDDGETVITVFEMRKR